MDKSTSRVAMDIVERGHISLQKVARYWNIPFTSFLDHLNGRIRRGKMGPQGVLTKHEDARIVTWVFNMQIIGYLSPCNS
jgi:predicted HTH domain antitoxin